MYYELNTKQYEQEIEGKNRRRKFWVDIWWNTKLCTVKIYLTTFVRRTNDKHSCRKIPASCDAKIKNFFGDSACQFKIFLYFTIVVLIE